MDTGLKVYLFVIGFLLGLFIVGYLIQVGKR